MNRHNFDVVGKLFPTNDGAVSGKVVDLFLVEFGGYWMAYI